MRRQIVGWLTASMLISGTAWAQEPTTVKDDCKSGRLSGPICGAFQPEQKDVDAARGWRHANPKLRTVGWTMVVLGGLMALPWGESVHLPNADYCVKSSGTGAYTEVSNGSCGFESVQVKASAITAGTGLVLAMIGGRHVKVSASPTKVTAMAQVSW